MIRQMHHRLENWPHSAGTYSRAQCARVQRTRVGLRPPSAIDKFLEESFKVIRREGEDLPAEEAVLWGEIALDVHEAEDAVVVLMCEHESGKAAH